MTRNDSFRRKIIYICLIPVLLIPLAFVSQPATVSKGSGETSSSGILSKIRKDHRLSQAEISEVDPASESMKLATLGLRPVAVTMLWHRIQESKKKQQWDRMRTSTQTLIALQPNFIKVWEFQAHNLSYNISREFDDYQYRYHWVKEGLSYLMTGIAYNRKDHRIFDSLGFFFGLKLGRSDEKLQFRRMFRKDADYHAKMKDYGIDTFKIRSPELGGPDNWLAAYEWYDRSRKGVNAGFLKKPNSELMFYKQPPSQLRNYAIDYETEKRPDEAAQLAWEKALDEWTGPEFGDREILTSTRLPIYLEKLAVENERIDSMRDEMDKIILGLRDELDAIRKGQMTDEMWKAYNTPQELVTGDMFENLMAAKKVLDVDKDREFEAEVDRRLSEGSLKLTPAQKSKYDLLRLEIKQKLNELRFVSNYRTTVNYEYWRDRCESESQNETIEARKALFDARELVKQAKIDEAVVTVPKKDQDGQFIVDENNNQVMEQITEPGAIQMYEKSFNLWATVLDKYERLADDVMEDDLVGAMKEYSGNLRKIQAEWPLDFPLQELIDFRSARQLEDGLPTTASMADRIEAAKELEEAENAAKEALKDLNIAPEAKKDEAKKDEAKKDEAKKDEAKKDEAKKDEAKKDEAKKDEAKKA